MAVTEEFLNQLKIDKEKYQDVFVNYFQNNNTNFLLFQNNDILEITQLKEDIEEDKEDDKLDEMETIKNMILLYANDSNFYDKLYSPIKDEYDMNKYYLINGSWVVDYQKKICYERIKQELEKMKLDLNFNGYIRKINKIAADIKSKNIYMKRLSKNDDIFKEDKFYPDINDKDFKDISYPVNFSLVPEILFDSLYKQINKSNKYQKSDYSYNVILGENAFIIQDKNVLSAYHVFFDDFELYYILNYNDEFIIHDEIKKYIQGKGFLNYVIEKNLNYSGNKDFIDLPGDHNDENKIGKYLNIKQVKEELITKGKIKKMINDTHLYDHNNKFLDDITNLSKNEINIKDIFNKNKIKHLEKIQVGIVLDKDLVNLEQQLFFDEIAELSKCKNEDYNKALEKIINKSYHKYRNINLSEYVGGIKIYGPEDIDKDKRKYNIYYFINLELLKMINDSEDFIKKLESQDNCFYFINNDENYILFEKSQKVYQIVFLQGNQSFKLKPIDIESENDNENKINDKEDAKDENNENENILDILLQGCENNPRTKI